MILSLDSLELPFSVMVVRWNERTKAACSGLGQARQGLVVGDRIDSPAIDVAVGAEFEQFRNTSRLFKRSERWLFLDEKATSVALLAYIHSETANSLP